VGGRVGGQFRSALAARHCLDDEGDNDQREYRTVLLEYAAQYQSQQ